MAGKTAGAGIYLPEVAELCGGKGDKTFRGEQDRGFPGFLQLQHRAAIIALPPPGRHKSWGAFLRANTASAAQPSADSWPSTTSGGMQV